MDQPYRQTSRLMRIALIAGAFLTFLSGIQLFVFTERTADLFAWTIAAGSSAAILGAFYWTASVLAFLSWRRQPWARARVGIPGVTLFLWATLLTTVLHYDKFHFALTGSAQFAAWMWLVIYIADPILVTVAWVLQAREPGADPPRRQPLATPYRYALGAFAAVLIGVALGMIFIPDAAVSAAAWPLTPLTSRAVGAWVLAVGVLAGTMAWEDDADRIRPAAIAMLVGAALMAIGLARYWGQFAMRGPGLAVAGFIAALAILGLVGVLAGRGGNGEPASGSSRR